MCLALPADGATGSDTADFRDALRVYYELSGKPPMLPRWALGNWWSRYCELDLGQANELDPYSAEGYSELMERFKQEKVPLSVAVLDMDW